MSGLLYLCEYGDDTESEENSYEEENLTKDTNSKDIQKLKLPPPNISRVSVVPSEEHIDDPSLHGGRFRTFQHVRGNWASFVYIEYPDEDSLVKVINKLSSIVSTVESSYCKCEDIHLSLSKTFTLKYHMIKTFTSSLQEVLNNIESFELGFESVEVYCNEDSTRTFVALKVDVYTYKYLLNISKQIDTILEDFKLPKFYDKPSFHVSIISIVGNKKQEILNILGDLNEIFTKQDERALETFVINRVNCKIGNKIYQYYLK